MATEAPAIVRSDALSSQADNDAQVVELWVTVASCTSITCPANITQPNDPNQCGAFVSYPPPTNSGACEPVICSPASGSFFLVGTTTVICRSSAGPTCTFTVTVNDTQPPTITCPANLSAVTNQTTCNATTCQTVSFTATASDNCPGVVVDCNPASGSCFPIGTTTVNCTATDASGNTASCSFTVTTFDICLQDDSNPATQILINSQTGDYRFCVGGTIFTGKGTIANKGCIWSLQHYAPDRRVLADIDKTQFRGKATLQSPPGILIGTIMDRDTRNNRCSCGVPAM